MITIGIIGVVAAISFPTLISKYKEKVYDSQYKKAKNTISNGFNLMMSKNEVTSFADVPLMSIISSSDSSPEQLSSEFKKYFSIIDDSFPLLGDYSMVKNLPEEYKIPGSEETYEDIWSNMGYIFTTSDGMIAGWDNYTDASNNYSTMTIAVDTNSAKKPNTVNEDLYLFQVSGFSNIKDITYTLLPEQPEPEPPKDCSRSACGGCTMEELNSFMQLYPEKCPFKDTGVGPSCGYYCM